MEEKTNLLPKNKPDCYLNHPEMTFKFNDNSAILYGGACDDAIENCDLYVSLDEGAPVYDFEQPWNENENNQKHIRFFIDDFDIPDDAEQFDACVDYVIDYLQNGKKVHVGCKAGHGRTGMFLSALVQKIMSKELEQQKMSAIDYVRKNYCKKAVETLEQVFFLYANYDIKEPIRERALMEYIKEEFKERIGVSLDQVIQLGEFDECVDVISNIESELLANYKNQIVPTENKKNQDEKLDKSKWANPNYNWIKNLP